MDAGGWADGQADGLEERLGGNCANTICFHSILKGWLGAWKKDLDGARAKAYVLIAFRKVDRGVRKKDLEGVVRKPYDSIAL